MKNHIIITLVFVALFKVSLTGSTNHTLTLSNGDRLTGKLLEVSDDKWVFETPYVGVVRIPVVNAEVRDLSGKLLDAQAYAQQSSESVESQESSQYEWTELNRLLRIPEDWKGEFTLGVNNIRGTSEKDSIAWSSRTTIPYWDNTFTWSTFYRYAESTQVKDVDTYGTSLRFRHPRSDRSFIQSTSIYRADHIQGVDHEINQTVGYGYAVIKQENLVFNVVPGIGVQYVSQPGTDDGTKFAYNFSEDLTWNISETVDFEHSFNINAPAEDVDDYRFVVKNGLSTRFSESYLIRLGYDYDFTNKVAAGRKKYTSTLTTSIGYTF